MSLERRKSSGNTANLVGITLLVTIFWGLAATVCTAVSSARELSNNYPEDHRNNIRFITSDLANHSKISAQTNSNQTKQWQRAKIAVKNRYIKDDIVDLVGQLDESESFDLLLQTWQLITYYYYNDIEIDTLVKNAILELQASIDSENVREKYQLSIEQAHNLKNYIKQQSNAHINSSHVDFPQLKLALENISNYCKGIGLDSSWPIIETTISLCSNLDIYSDYIMPKKYKNMMQSLDGNYKGIGTDLIFSASSYPVVFDVLKDSPADKNGIQPGDKLIEISNVDLKNISSEQFDLIFNKTDEQIHIKTLRNTEFIELNLQKESLNSSTIRNTTIFSQSRTGYLRITSFNKHTDQELRQELNKLSGKIDSLIIDLRNNGGGIVTSAVNSADLFMTDGKIVSIKTFSDRKTYNARPDNIPTEKIKLCILVNKHTASSAEIFTAALKQNDRAVIIGEKTFGKALVQTVYNLRHNAGAVILTTAEYLPPSEQSFNLKGITPNIELIDTENTVSALKTECISDRISLNNPAMKLALSYISN